jgi:hypothetical protein
MSNETAETSETRDVFEPVVVQSLHAGTQRLYRFDNGYGASVVRHEYSYGTELAVIRWDGSDFDLNYDTPLTNDVIGHLTESEVGDLLRRISKLTPDGREADSRTEIETPEPEQAGGEFR